MSRILIIDDEDKYFELCQRFIAEHEFLPPVRNYREAASVLKAERGTIDLVLLDVHFDIPDEELLPSDKTDLLAGKDAKRAIERLRRAQGLHILDRLRRSDPDLPVIVMTARDDLPIEADSERLQAEDYTYLLDDEYLDARSLRLQIENILAQRAGPSGEEDEPFYWGETAKMQGLRRRLSILARGQLPIILLGATGTGKSLLAREFIHARSQREGPFVAVDLSTVPHDLMAAHLFGVVKGAYTGATTSREGVLEHAQGGTLFLDEIGNLSVDLQKSLLLVLQEGRYRPVGSVDERVADVKLVVATNENLVEMVREGKFREDLYMRLNPATAMRLPSLTERKDDFSVLLEVFVSRVSEEAYNADLLRQYAQQRGLAVPESDAVPVSVGRKVPTKADSRRIHFVFHPSSYKQLRDFSWPGNFRQFEMFLSNLITLSLVELVDQAEVVEPDNPADASRPDVIPILPRIVRELMRPMDISTSAPQDDGASVRVLDDGAHRLSVTLRDGESLNAVSCAVERQYLELLFEKYEGDLARMAGVLLSDPTAGRKVQLRMNQLGIKLRSLKQRRRAR
ncbi:MAG: sigma-54-dependent transcriptional regulator [Nannocystaceae bacterium]|nr:sigma 54-interacting transcriptional regulator [bacterium]